MLPLTSTYSAPFKVSGMKIRSERSREPQEGLADRIERTSSASAKGPPIVRARESLTDLTETRVQTIK